MKSCYQHKEITIDKTDLYKNPLNMTSQFPMCGNCFRADTYKGCDFGCRYCFANNRQGAFIQKNQISDMNLIKKWMYESIKKNETNNIKKELLNKFVPLHLGGMADPFQSREWKYGITKEFLNITNKYNYPVIISTKVGGLPDDYWELLNPEIHVFQISLIGISDSYIRKWEKNTPLAGDRIRFVKELKSSGFWVSIRIQPLIDIGEAIKVIKETEKYVDYYTVEHLKIPLDNKIMTQNIFKLLDKYYKLIACGREYEFNTSFKKKNIETLKKTTNIKIGCGDNDLHTLSDSLNCCGVDTMPKAFKNWLKYNSMYIKMAGDRTHWCPINECTELNGACIIKGYSNKDYVERNYLDVYGDDKQEELFP